jgi:hypothetical protein
MDVNLHIITMKNNSYLQHLKGNLLKFSIVYDRGNINYSEKIMRTQDEPIDK